jgi:hypothetical protein
MLNKSSNETVTNSSIASPIGKIKSLNKVEVSSLAKISVDMKRMEDKIPDIKSILLFLIIKILMFFLAKLCKLANETN